MKVSELIGRLNEIQAENGDLVVEVPVLGDTAPVDSVDVYVRSNGNDIVIIMGES
jgi:hypothetical protein